MKYLLTILIIGPVLFFNSYVQASENEHVSLFIKSEFNDTDSIYAIGASVLIKDNTSNIGISINSSIGPATVNDQDGFKQDYIAWEGGVKFGYFSDIFVYAEAGLDLAEFILDDRDEEDYEHFHYNDHHEHGHNEYEESNDIDAYIGVGVGINFGHVQLETFARLRQIDGQHWKADNNVYSGIQASLSF